MGILPEIILRQADLERIIMKYFIRLFTTLLVLIVSLGFPAQAASQTETIIFADPAGVPLGVGETLDIAIKIQDVTDLSAFDLEVHFDQEILLVTAVQLGDFLELGLPIGPFIDEENGIVNYANAQINPSEPKSGSGNLILISVEALENIDEVHLNITKAILSDRDGQLIPCRIINSDMVSLYLPLILR